MTALGHEDSFLSTSVLSRILVSASSSITTSRSPLTDTVSTPITVSLPEMFIRVSVMEDVGYSPVDGSLSPDVSNSLLVMTMSPFKSDVRTSTVLLSSISSTISRIFLRVSSLMAISPATLLLPQDDMASDNNHKQPKNIALKTCLVGFPDLFPSFSIIPFLIRLLLGQLLYVIQRLWSHMLIHTD